MIEPGLFVGTLRHRRFTPVPHAFVYRTFMALVDIDRVEDLMRVSRLTSHNRWNWASFDDRDHLGDPSRPLRERLLVDATQRSDTGRPLVPNSWLAYLPHHAVICDLVVDPFCGFPSASNFSCSSREYASTWRASSIVCVAA